MKHPHLFICLIAACLSFSCNRTSSDKNNTSSDSVSLNTAESQRDSLFSLIAAISQELSGVNEMESLVTATQKNTGRMPIGEQRRQIERSIADLHSGLQQSSMQLNELEQKMKQSGHYTAQLQKTIATQRALIAAEARKILELQHKLGIALSEIDRLSGKADSLDRHIDQISVQKAKAEQHSAAVSNELNACHFVVGTTDELKRHKILEKRFLGHRKVMEGNFDRTFFTRADKRTLREVPTQARRIRVLSKQPVNSYRIEDNNGLKTLVILDPTLFWEKSDFLVIETR